MKRMAILMSACLWGAACSGDVNMGRRCPNGDATCASTETRDGGASFGNGGNGHPSGGAGTIGTSDNALTVHVEDADKMTIEIVTLACSGDCVDIEAVAQGGNAPYTFAWDDGSTSAKRHVCLDARTRARAGPEATTSAIRLLRTSRAS